MAAPDPSITRIDGPWRHLDVHANGIRFHVVEALPNGLRAGPDAVPSAAAVVGHGVNGAAGKVRTSHIPLAAFLVRAKDERAFHRADEQNDIAVVGFDVMGYGHRVSPVKC